jgi:hypothetical protein
MLDILNLSALVALMLVIWFNTSAFPEYFRLFREEFFLAKSKDENLHYGLFLKNKYNTFVTKILACYVCCSVWISVVLCFLCNSLSFFGLVNVLGLGMYLAMNKLAQ